MENENNVNILLLTNNYLIRNNKKIISKTLLIRI